MEEIDEERWEETYEQVRRLAQKSSKPHRSGHVDTIPVVVHVIHDNGPANISYEQVKDGIRVMNEDFNRRNADSSDTRSVFDSLAADSEIHFRLARYAPDGECHNGVTRTASDLTHSANDAVKELIRWPTDQYLNFWLADHLETSGNNTLLGYAQFPWSGIDDTYGVVQRHDRFGTIGTSNSDGRTATHEVGHCLGLFHTFQGHGCGDDCSSSGDNICDTPPSEENTFACDKNQNSCSNDTVGPSPYNSDVVDQIENYMSYDACQNMFTKGQKSVMKAALSNVGGLQNLISKANLKATGVREDPLCKADFSTDRTLICAGEKVRFSDISYHMIQDRNWIFHGGSPFFALGSKNPEIRYPDPGLYDVELTVTQGQDALTTHKKELIRVLEVNGVPTPFIEDMENNPIGERIFPRENRHDLLWQHTQHTGASGTSSLVLENYYANKGEAAEFETRTIDASADSNVAISFKVAHRQKKEGDDGVLNVYATKGCEEGWSLRGSFNSSELKTGAAQASYFKGGELENWKRFSIEHTLSFGYNTEELRFKFEFISDGGNNIYIDDINVAAPQVLSTEEEKKTLSELELYPNPATERVHVRTEEKSFRYSLKNAQGKQVGEGGSQGSKATLSVGNLPSGLYFLHIEGESSSTVRKLIVR